MQGDRVDTGVATGIEKEYNICRRNPNMNTLREMFGTVTRQNESRAAIVEDGVTTSYALLEKSVLSLALRLHRQGIRQGDRVALLLPNGSEFVIGFFAAVEAGTIVVPLNDHYQQDELIYFIKACGISLLITAREHASLCQRVLSVCQSTCRLLFVEDRETATETERRVWGDLRPEINPETPVLYQFSSGSTGKPKQIARTQTNLLFELDSFHRTLQITNEDRFLGVAPFSHVNGLMRSMMASLWAGATLYPLPKFERQSVAEAVERNRISIFIAVPFMFSILAKSNFRQQPDFSSLRLCVSASAPMPPNHNEQFHESFGIYVRQLYGSTETGTISVNLRPDIEATLESVGTPILGVGVEVFKEDGGIAEPGEVGEFAVKSPAAITEYMEADESSKKAFRNGYFFTGDLGKREGDGLLTLTGRKKFFINKGGYKIDPHEIEGVLGRHPKVEEAVAVGLPTAFGDEKIKAIVVLKEPATVEELVEYCRGRIADFKVPSLIEFRESLPRSPTGKILRTLLK